MADDPKVEIELALRDSMSAALVTVGREMAKLNKQAQESAQSGSGLRNVDSLLTNMGKSLLGPLGIAAGLVAAAKSLDTFAVSQLQLRNFARDTGFSTEAVSRLRAQLAVAGVDAGRASAAIGTIGQKMQDAASIPFGSDMVRQLARFNPELARTVQHFASAGDEIKVLEAIHNAYINSSTARQNLITQATGLTRTEILALGTDVRGLVKDWTYPEEASQKYHRTIYNLEKSLSNIWKSISQTAVEEINKISGSWENMDETAQKVAKTLGGEIGKFVRDITKFTEDMKTIMAWFESHGGANDPLKTAPPVPMSESNLGQMWNRLFGRKGGRDREEFYAPAKPYLPGQLSPQQQRDQDEFYGRLPKGARPTSFSGDAFADMRAFEQGGVIGTAERRGYQMPGWLAPIVNYLRRSDVTNAMASLNPLMAPGAMPWRGMMAEMPVSAATGALDWRRRLGLGGDQRDLINIESDSNKILIDIRGILQEMETGAHGGQGGGGGLEVYGSGIRGGQMQAGLGGFRPTRGGRASEAAPMGHVNLPANKRETAGIIAEEWRKAGMSESGIAGIMANVRSESGFNPTLRHPDQPRFSGEAHYAHGLYQEGGDEWNNYARWLKENYPDADWRDPRLQSRFAAERLKTGYSSTWARMQRGSKEEAAVAYLRGYLKPAAGFQAQRSAQYMRGVPGVEAYTGSESARTAINGSIGKSVGATVSGNLNAEVDFKNVPPGVRTSAEGTGFKILKVTATKQAMRAGEGMLYPGDTAYTPWVP